MSALFLIGAALVAVPAAIVLGTVVFQMFQILKESVKDGDAAQLLMGLCIVSILVGLMIMKISE